MVEALKSMTQAINHNNTITGGYEKDRVVSLLLALHDARVSMDAEAMQGWALANGWSGKNPARLATYVVDINAGKRPRVSNGYTRSDIVEHLRAKVQARHE